METRNGKSGAMLVRTLDRPVPLRLIWLGLGMVACLGLATPAHAGTIFVEDYEVSDITALQAKGWQLSCSSSPCTTDIVTSPVHGGSKALRMTYQGIHCTALGACDDSRNSKITRSIGGQDEVYESYYVRYAPIDPTQPSGFDTKGFNPSAKQHYFNPGSPAPAAIPEYQNGDPRLGFAVNLTTSVVCPNGSTDITCNYKPNIGSVSMVDGAWHCVETHLKMNTPSSSDGIIEVWVDGIQTIQYTNVKFRDPGTAGSQFQSVQVYRQGADNQYRYEDDYVLSTTRVGCSGNPSTDVTPPVAPVGLFIR